jgi:hypothetical protein
MDAWPAEMRVWRKETTACQEVMEACLESKQPTSLEIESKKEHDEVHKGQAAVETFGALKEWYWDRHVAIRYHG